MCKPLYVSQVRCHGLFASFVLASILGCRIGFGVEIHVVFYVRDLTVVIIS